MTTPYLAGTVARRASGRAAFLFSTVRPLARFARELKARRDEHRAIQTMLRERSMGRATGCRGL